ncbi:hypothetical protein PG987_003098 [Apiospora arundinis]
MPQMSRIASSKDEAESHIEKLREDRGGGRHSQSNAFLAVNLDGCLKLVSDQLYQNPTRFLLELIQNADDNSYASGIGFKSVFKVADVVRIASGHYEFQFNRDDPLGMIMPILARFPSDDRVPGHTQILMHLDSTHAFEGILSDLEEIEPHILMFLRKLHRLHVTTPRSDKIYQRIRNEFDPDFGGETMTIQTCQSGHLVCQTKYIVQRHNVADLPADARRDGVETSEIMVAFPVQDEVTPIVANQKAFAFLPVDDFGFRFLIHADFLLVASRESVEHPCPWNLKLRDGIRNAFLRAIGRLATLPQNDSGKGLCYTWPSYLPRRTGSSSFWNDLHSEILRWLQVTPILKSQTSNDVSRMPMNLRYVPLGFRFNGSPLFDLPSILKARLAFDYDEVYQELECLGIRQLGIDGLCADLEMFVTSDAAAAFQAKPMAWHRKVCSLFCNKSGLRERLRNLPIVPLRDGTWTTAKMEHVYLASDDDNEHVPAGVSLSIVDPEVCRDPVRRDFLIYLGIQQYSPKQVCSLILELHNADFYTRHRLVGDLVADVAYLFKYRRFVDQIGAPTIHFITRYDGRRVLRKSAIYCVDPRLRPGLIAKYQDSPGSPFAVLDANYEETICGGDETMRREFMQWLLQSDAFHNSPVLLKHRELTQEWTFLLNMDVVDLLQALRHHCEKYGTAGPDVRRLRDVVAGLNIRCLDGIVRALGTVAVPTEQLRQRCPNLPFVDLPGHSSNWVFLSEFGVLTTCNTLAWLRELQSLKDLPFDQFDKKAVHKVYKALDAAADSDKTQIERAFDQSALVFISNPTPIWVKHNTCVWAAPAELQDVVKLGSRYRDCKVLFCDCLGVRAASTQHVVNEMPAFYTGFEKPVERCLTMLFLLDKFLSKGEKLEEHHKRQLREVSIFPVVKSGEGICVPTWRALDEENWYIPDKSTLAGAFRGKVDLLSISPKTIHSVRNVFAALASENMFLSARVEEECTPTGTMVRDLLEETSLNSRIRYIASLTDESDFMNVLPEIRAWSVPFITITRRLDGIEGRQEEDLVLIEESGEFTSIYFRMGIATSHHEVIFKLVEYFSSLFDIRGEDTNLVNLLMTAPIGHLPTLMEKNGRFLRIPEDEKEEDTTDEAESMFCSENEGGSHEDDRSGEEQEGDGSEEVEDEQIEVASMPPHGQRLPVPTDEEPLQTLQELIPSHQSRAEMIAQVASNFHISNALTIKHAPRAVGVGPNSIQSLAIRTRGSSPFSHQTSPAATSATLHQGARDHENTARLHPGVSNIHQATSPSVRRSRPRTEDRVMPVGELRFREIGFLGELFIHKRFGSRIEDWCDDNWTSKLRVEAGIPRFTGQERDFADFTYLDSSGQMREMLRDAEMDLHLGWSNDTTYHLEVKSTSGSGDEAFFVSQNQVDMMRRYNNDALHAYILVRVSNIENADIQLKFYPDPWNLYMNQVLDFRSEEGYRVFADD